MALLLLVAEVVVRGQDGASLNGTGNGETAAGSLSGDLAFVTPAGFGSSCNAYNWQLTRR